VNTLRICRPVDDGNPPDELRALTAQLIATRKQLGDLEHLRDWNSDLRHRLWRARIRAELDVSAIADIDAIIDEIADYHAAVALLCKGDRQ